MTGWDSTTSTAAAAALLVARLQQREVAEATLRLKLRHGADGSDDDDDDIDDDEDDDDDDDGDDDDHDDLHTTKTEIGREAKPLAKNVGLLNIDWGDGNASDGGGKGTGGDSKKVGHNFGES